MTTFRLLADKTNNLYTNYSCPGEEVGLNGSSGDNAAFGRFCHFWSMEIWNSPCTPSSISTALTCILAA